MTAGARQGCVKGAFSAHSEKAMRFEPAYHPKSDAGVVPCRCSVCRRDVAGAGVKVTAEGLPNYHWICCSCAGGIHDAARKGVP